MTLPLILRTIRSMIRDTFRQSLASKLFWGMVAITLIAVLLCFSLEVHGDMAKPALDYDTSGFLSKKEAERLGPKKVMFDNTSVVSGDVSIGFGLVTIPLGRHRDDAVKFIQLWLAGAVADTVGVLLALLWTAGFLPNFLEPQTATVLLAKPTPRWAILLGKYLGVTLFVALQASFFVGGTWLALGLKTGVWNFSYLLAVPLLTLNFGIFYSVCTFLAVVTRSTIASVFGTLMVWLLCWAINVTHIQLNTATTTGVSASSKPLVAVAYWTLPKPFDMGAIFYDALKADTFSEKPAELELAQAAGTMHPELSVITSMLFALAVLVAAAYEFRHTDY